MKRNAPNHPKHKRLARELKINLAWANGIVERMIHFTAEYHPGGDIGASDNLDIAEACAWPKSPDVLIEKLMAARLVDEDSAHRLIVHDWSQHADDATHMKLARAGLRFADGTMPKMSRLSAAEREDAKRVFAQRANGVHTDNAQDTHGKRTVMSSPSPSHATPESSPRPARSAAVMSDERDEGESAVDQCDDEVNDVMTLMTDGGMSKGQAEKFAANPLCTSALVKQAIAKVPKEKRGHGGYLRSVIIDLLGEAETEHDRAMLERRAQLSDEIDSEVSIVASMSDADLQQAINDCSAFKGMELQHARRDMVFLREAAGRRVKARFNGQLVGMGT
jgi:hypothetical protein